MTQVARYDFVEVRKPERTAQGFLRADAVLTRSGIFHYRNHDGSIRREYRPPEEVFHADALSSFEDAPITIDHPDRLITKENARQFTVGMVKDTPRRDGSFAVARVLVTDASAIDEVENGRRRSVSCGYECDYDPTSGVTPDGERFDGIQRNIRGNHLALVPVGRAGPGAQVRLDADDAIMVADPSAMNTPINQEIKTMAKVRLDGVDYEAIEQLAQAITVANEKHQKRVDELDAKLKEQNAEAEKAKARADTAADEAKKAKERADAAEKPERIRDAVKARVDIERRAVAMLGEEVKLDAMDDAQVKRAIIEQIYPEAKPKLEGASAEYLQARYDSAIEEFDKRPNEGLGELRRDATSAETRTDVAKSREKFYADEANAWQAKAK